MHSHREQPDHTVEREVEVRDAKGSREVATGGFDWRRMERETETERETGGEREKEKEKREARDYTLGV